MRGQAIGVNAAQQMTATIGGRDTDDVLVEGHVDGALYARVSSEVQEEGHSLDTQVTAMLATAQELGWRIRRNHVFRETHGGESVFDRPALTRLRCAAATGDVRAVVFYHPDRFARSPVWMELIFKEMLHFQVRVAFVQGDAALGADTSDGYLLRYLSGYAAQTELEQHKERTARGKIARLGNGRCLVPCGRGPLYGYRFADLELQHPDGNASKIIPKARYVVHDDEAQVVRQMFKWLLAGWTARAITIELTRRRVPPRRSRVWSRSTVQKMLRDASYCGEGHAHKHKVVKVRCGGQTKNMVVPRPREEWVPYAEGVIPPIIDRATFETAQAILRTKAEAAVNTCANPEKYLLRGGFVLCGLPGCGSAMIVETKRNEGRHTPSASYMCNKAPHGTDLPVEDRRPGMQKIAIRCRILDAAAWNDVLRILDDRESVRQQFARLRGADPTELDLAALDRRIGDVTRRQRNLVEAIEEQDDAEARAALRARWAALRDEDARLTTEREVVLARRKEWQDAQAQVDEAEAWCVEHRADLDQMPNEIKRKILRALDVRVIVYPHDHEPRFETTSSIPLQPPTLH